MARKKTQQEENVNEVEQVVVDTNDKEDPWDGYYSGTLMNGESEVLNSEPGIIDDGGTIDTSGSQNPVSEYNTMDAEQQKQQQQQQASGMQINISTCCGCIVVNILFHKAILLKMFSNVS